MRDLPEVQGVQLILFDLLVLGFLLYQAVLMVLAFPGFLVGRGSQGCLVVRSIRLNLAVLERNKAKYVYRCTVLYTVKL